MSDDAPHNPYISPVLTPDRDLALAGDEGSRKPKSGISKSNIAGLIITFVMLIAFGSAIPAFVKIFKEFKIELPVVTKFWMEATPVFYGVGINVVALLFLLWFLIGMFVRPRKLASVMGMLGLGGLILSVVSCAIAMFLPLIALINNLSQK